eukprot:COSAG02_NODE_61552_length_268_cov_0.615385_1_plen_29_part_01
MVSTVCVTEWVSVPPHSEDRHSTAVGGQE